MIVWFKITMNMRKIRESVTAFMGRFICHFLLYCFKMFQNESIIDLIIIFLLSFFYFQFVSI